MWELCMLSYTYCRFLLFETKLFQFKFWILNYDIMQTPEFELFVFTFSECFRSLNIGLDCLYCKVSLSFFLCAHTKINF